MKISIMLPTRNRPIGLERFINSIIDTSVNLSNIELIISYDEDDIVTEPIINKYKDKINIISKQSPSRDMIAKNNDMIKYINGDILAAGSDDVIYKTIGWDKIIINKFNEYKDKIILIYGKDGIQDEILGTHFFIHKNWVETLGYYNCTLFKHCYCDTWANELAKRIGRLVYMPNIITEHLHWSKGKSEHDNVYINSEKYFTDEVKIWHSTEHIRIKEANKLLNFINTYA